MRLVALAFLGWAASAGAYWQGDTTTLQAPRLILVNKGGVGKPAYPLYAGKPVRFSLEQRCAMRWTIQSDSAGQVEFRRTLGRKDSSFLVQKLVKGMNDVRLFCEPDEYRLIASVTCRTRVYRWRTPSILPVVPAGGGIPIPLMMKGGGTDDYFQASPDTAALLKVLGPATAYVYVRPYAPVAGHAVPLDMEVREGETVVTRMVITPVPSGEVAFMNSRIGVVPGRPTMVRVEVPAGVHTYSVRPLNDRAMVRFSFRRKAVRSAPKPAPLAREEPREPPPEDPGPRVAASATTGLYYNENVYSYGGETFANYRQTPSRAYRYPKVESLGDAFLPLEARASLASGSLRARGTLGARKYWNNGQLDDFNVSVAVGWLGPEQGSMKDTSGRDAGSSEDPDAAEAAGPLQGRILAELAYTTLPNRPIRPAYSAVAGGYSLLSFWYHRGDLRLRIRNAWNPEMRLSMGYYDYVREFDYLDAMFLEGGLGLKASRTLGLADAVDWTASLAFGNVLAMRAADYDWSNAYLTAAAGVNFDRRNWTVGLRGRVQPRFFSAASDSDSNKGRRDLEGEIDPTVQYHFRRITVTAHVLEATARRSWARKREDELARSYFTLGGGLDLSADFDPMDWTHPHGG